MYDFLLIPSLKQSQFGNEVFEHAMQSLRQGQRDLGVELLAEAIAIFEQIYGIVHPDTARVYRNMAMIQHEMGNSKLCLEYQRKAVIVSERTLGVDNPDTIQQLVSVYFFQLNFIKFFKSLIWDILNLSQILKIYSLEFAT